MAMVYRRAMRAAHRHQEARTKILRRSTNSEVRLRARSIKKSLRDDDVPMSNHGDRNERLVYKTASFERCGFALRILASRNTFI
jgi:hypothetical protein